MIGSECSPVEEKIPLFGDLHVHTALSLDAWTQGAISEPADAYKFAKGEVVSLPPYIDGNGLRSAKLRKSLDFAAVTDHAELLGEVELCTNPDSNQYSSLECKAFRNFPTITYYRYNTNASRGNPNAICGDNRLNCTQASITPWEKTIIAAEDHNHACQFTTFVGYEWTGAKYSGNNFHRNIIFYGNNIPKQPTSFYEAPTKKELWSILNEQCSENCQFISIPHNSNLSNGQMFLREEDLSIDEQLVFEPVIEIFQHKGSSECHPVSDTFCNFEQLPYKDFISKTYKDLSSSNDIPPLSFARETLLNGLAVKQQELGNPWKFGFIGSTDTHYAMPGYVDEENFQGHGGAGKSFRNSIPKGLPDDAEFNPGGLAVVWAKQNDRKHIFEALQNREVYGTSGPKFILRFFGSENFEENMCENPEIFTDSYRKGVPMGGTLHSPKNISFLIAASADQSMDNQFIERVQIIKGYIEDGNEKTNIFDIFTNESVTLDRSSCRIAGQGVKDMCMVWQDNTFEASQDAFYYVRVLANESCRWTHELCIKNPELCSDANSLPQGINERAWSSPIWLEAN
jgi:hypothetical protein